MVGISAEVDGTYSGVGLNVGTGPVGGRPQRRNWSKSPVWIRYADDVVA